jgi:tRNA dimethylallyltransferase
MIFVICGQTASGKSSLALEFAKKINGIIVNADAFQVYKELNIGTAKPSLDERKEVPHLLYDICSVKDNYDVKRYQDDARKVIDENSDKPLVFVGGTGLYIRSTFFDYEFNESPKVDLSKFDSFTNEELHDYLAKIDKESAEKFHPNNRRRVLRAIEIYLSTGETKSNLEKKQQHHIIYDDIVFVAVELDSKVLNERINDRVDKMFQKGLQAEIAELLLQYPSNLQAFSAIGYKEIMQNQDLSEDELKDLIKLRTRQYAKRQKTFFKHQLPVTWFNSNEEALTYLLGKYEEFTNGKTRTL